VHPTQLVEPNIGVFGVHLLHLGHRPVDVLAPALEEIFRRVTVGELAPVIDSTFSLDRAGAVEAHAYLHARRNLGKVVLVSEEAR
jgi:NADPH:quinone reductase-like Zn-dependent oxidoreductase